MPRDRRERYVVLVHHMLVAESDRFLKHLFVVYFKQFHKLVKVGVFVHSYWLEGNGSSQYKNLYIALSDASRLSQ